MTIQPSVIVWTVLCFAALYCILKYLLFDPVLAVMDAREKKISDAKKAAEAARARAEEERSRALEDQKSAAQARLAAEAAQADRLRREGKERLDEAERAHFERLSAYRAASEAAFDADLKQAEAGTSEAADLFLSRLYDTEQSHG